MCPPPNVLAEMTDFMLIHIYPALITLQDVRSEHPAFNAVGRHMPTPVCPCLPLPAASQDRCWCCTHSSSTGDRQATSQSGISHGI